MTRKHDRDGGLAESRFRPTLAICTDSHIPSPFHRGEKITEEAAGSGRLIFRYKILLLENEQYDCMKKYFVIGLMALGLSAFIPQPAKAGVHFGIFVGPPAYYYPGYYPDYYYGYPYYYGPRYYHRYGYYRPWGYRHYHRWHHWD
jgi:hypothetical protein